MSPVPLQFFLTMRVPEGQSDELQEVIDDIAAVTQANDEDHYAGFTR